MRATYEDLLRAARRIAVDTAAAGYQHRSDVVADWYLVVQALESHLLRLHYALGTAKPYKRSREHSTRGLGRLSQALSSAGDLVGAADAGIVDEPVAVNTARAEVASIALIGADLVVAATRERSIDRFRLNRLTAELEKLAGSGSHREGLGRLGRLPFVGAPPPGDHVLLLARSAAHWERVDGEMSSRTLLAGDLRSTTAQIRTACAYVWHLAEQARTAQQAEWEPWQRLSLKLLQKVIRDVEVTTLSVAESWEQGLVDSDGHAAGSSEAAFMKFKATFDQVVRPGGKLLEPDTLIPGPSTAVRVLAVIDEILWSVEQVGRRQQRTVAALMGLEQLISPESDLRPLVAAHLRREANAASLQSRRRRPTPLPKLLELFASLDRSVDQLALAALSARRLVEDSDGRSRRASAPGHSPAPYVELPDPDQGRLL